MTVVAQVAQWSPTVAIDGADVSASLHADIVLDTERDAAGTAKLVLDVAGIVEPDLYTGKAVTLDVTSAGVTLRRFTGYVEESELEPFGNTLRLLCTDGRAAKLNGMDRASIDALVGPPHAAFVRDDYSGSRYCQAALEQQFVSLNLDANGAWEFYPITAAAVPKWSFDGGDFEGGSLLLRLTPARDVVNALTLVATAQRERYWWRRAATSWRWLNTFLEYLTKSRTLPNESMFRSAAEGLGWHVNSYTFEHLPESGLYYADTGNRVPDGVTPGATTATHAWTNNFPELITRGTARLEKWWTQRVNYAAKVRIEVATSIARYGLRTDSLEMSWQARDTLEWAQAKTPAERPVPDGTPREQAGGYRYYDSTDTVEDEAFVSVALDRALRVLYDAHCNNTVSFVIPYHLDATLGAVTVGDTVLVEHAGRRAQGIVTRVTETLSISASDASIAVTLTLCRGGTAGVTAPQLTYVIPAADPTDPALGDPVGGDGYLAYEVSAQEQLGNEAGAVYDDTHTGYSGNYGVQYATPGTPLGPLFPVRLDLDAPDIPATLRDTVDGAHEVTIAATLPHDLLELDLGA